MINVKQTVNKSARKCLELAFRGAGLMALVLFLAAALLIALMSVNVSAQIYYSPYGYSGAYDYGGYYPTHYESYEVYQPDGLAIGYGVNGNDWYAESYNYGPYGAYRYSNEPSYTRYELKSYNLNGNNDCNSDWECEVSGSKLNNADEWHVLTHHVPVGAIVDTSGWDYWKTPDSRTSAEAYGDGQTNSATSFGNKQTYNTYSYSNSGNNAYYTPQYDSNTQTWNWRF